MGRAAHIAKVVPAYRSLGAHLVALGLLLVCWSPLAYAHKASDSYLHLSASGATVDAQWDIALRDLDVALNLDANGDGQLTWGEVRQAQSRIVRYALGNLQLRSAGALCVPRAGEPLIDDHSDGAYFVLRFTARCVQPVQALQLDYQLFSMLDAGHRGLVNLTLGPRVFTAVLGPANPRARFSAAEASSWREFAGYLRTGVEHIWSGFDHLLFLFSLLLPAVLLRAERHWQPQTALAPALKEVLQVVTAFTVAHSLTLGLATFGVVRLPSRISESAIALSVVIAALNNVVPVVRHRRWIVAFAFGLIHGFGFANVLADLGLPRNALTLALVGFNLGVEAGQLAIVMLFMPVAFLLRETLFYRRYLIVGGSGAIAMVAALWLVERAFDLKFLAIH